jgi:hypothetical protein
MRLVFHIKVYAYLQCSWDGEMEDAKLQEIKRILDREGFFTTGGSEDGEGWAVGIVQLVDTSKPVEQWDILAERPL